MKKLLTVICFLLLLTAAVAQEKDMKEFLDNQVRAFADNPKLQVFGEIIRIRY